MKILNKYGFEDGLNGWLSLSGVYIACATGKHREIVENCETQGLVKPIFKDSKLIHGERLFELLGYIKFICPEWGCNGNNSYVFFPQVFGFDGNVTKEQRTWLLSNFSRMTSSQESDIKEFLSHFCKTYK